MQRRRKYFIKTFGCQANIADSGAMAGVLEELGWKRYVPKPVKNEDLLLEDVLRNVDLLVVNTCSVRQRSEDKVYGIGRIVKRVVKETRHKPTIVISGCMVGSAVGERKRFELSYLQKKMPWVDVLLESGRADLLPEILNTGKNIDNKRVSPVIEGGDLAYVNISTGCDNFCSYCVVPYARGKEVSRQKDDILREVKSFIDRGYTRIMLCGQNVNSWGLSMGEKMSVRSGESRSTPFVGLLTEVRGLEGLEELSFISSNPFDFTAELIEALKLPKMSKYLHIAVQSGNNEVLKRMNRRHTVEEFINLVRKIEEAVPDIELGTDIIVGFSGETRDQFMDTAKLFETVSFKVAFISIYSPRKGTSAEKLYKDDISREEKKWRHAYLTKVWREGLKKCKRRQ